VFRALCVAVALAMTPADASAQAGSYQELPAAWAASYLPLPAGWEFIELQDWTLVDADDDILVFVQAARQPMHIWVRWEKKRALPTGLRSWRDLVQVDCSGGRTRLVTNQAFNASNLEELVGPAGEAAPWTFPAPGSRAEIPLLVLCD
jgi:hypothetical protein